MPRATDWSAPTRWGVWGLLGLLGLWAVSPFWLDFSRVRVPEPNDDWDNQLLLAEAQREAVWTLHSLPLWNRYPEGGSPLLANPESTIAYPLTWLTLPLDPQVGLRLQVVLHLLIGLATTVVFLRSLRVSPVGAAYGAMVYMGASLFAERMQVGHLMWMGMAWIPLVLRAGIDSGARARRVAAFALAALWLMGAHYLLIFSVVGLVILRWGALLGQSRRGFVSIGVLLGVLLIAPRLIAPWSQLLLLLPFGPILLELPRSVGLELKRLLLLGGLAAGLSAVKLVPALELLRFSSRLQGAELEPALQVDVWTMVAKWGAWVGRDGVAPHEDQPSLWHGLPLMVAVGGLLRVQRAHLGLIALLVLATLWSLGDRAGLDVAALLQGVPVVSFVRYPTRAAVLTLLCLAALAGGMVSWSEARVRSFSPRKAKVFYGLMYLSLFLSAGWMALQSRDQYGGLFVEPVAQPDQKVQSAGVFERHRCTGSMYRAFQAGQGCVDGFSAIPLVNARNVRGVGDEAYRGEAWVEGGQAMARLTSHVPNQVEVRVEPPLSSGTLVLNQSYLPGWTLDNPTSASFASAQSVRGLLGAPLDGRTEVYRFQFSSLSAGVGGLISLVVLGFQGFLRLKKRKPDHFSIDDARP